MPSGRSIISRHEIGVALARRMAADPDLRRRLREDPGQVYERMTGERLPPGVRIVLLQDDAHTLHFVLPMHPPDAAELSDADLEAVAAGGAASWSSVSAAVSQIGFQVSQSIGGLAVREKW